VKHIANNKLNGSSWPQGLAVHCVFTAITRKFVFAAGLFAAVAWLANGMAARASTISLTDANSTVVLDPGTSSGVSSWTVDGVNQLYQQWFWYRVGNTDVQASIDTLGPATITQSNAAEATISYTGTNGLTIAVTYLLTGGASLSGAATLGESIAITNGGDSAQDVHFFQYSNFTLDDQPSGDYVQFKNANRVDQWKGAGNEALSESVITPRPNYRETGQILPTNDPNYNPLYDTLYRLNNTPGLTLREPDSNTLSAPLGPGDMTWSYEWDRSIAAGSSFLISKAKSLSGVVQPIPEPSSLILVVASLLSLAVVARRRLQGR
jgi:hypothetical protein